MGDGDNLDKHPMIIDTVDDPPIGPSRRVIALPRGRQWLAYPVRLFGQDSANELDARRSNLLR